MTDHDAPGDPARPGGRHEARPGRTGKAGSTAQGVRDLHRLLVESARDYAIFALDREGHVLSWNPGAERFKGYAPEEIIGRHFSAFYPPEDVASGKPERELERAAAEGVVEDEGWRVRKDGGRFWANVVITALRGDEGELIGFAKVTRDLTERRAAVEGLRASEQRFRLLVQSVEDYGIFMLDPAGRVASWNEGAERIKGYTAEEILGGHVSVFFPEAEVAAGEPARQLEVAAATGRCEDEGWRVRKDGSTFWASVILTALRDEQGTLLGFTQITRDLSERREAEERALADARRLAQAEAESRMKSEFLASMSHELRTPLNAIGGYADLMSLGIHGPVTERQLEALERIRQGQQQLLGVINDLLNFSRIEAGGVTYELGPVPLAAVLEEVRPRVESLAAAKDIALEWSAPGADAVAHADLPRVQQIVRNLLANAVKFTPEGGRIRTSHRTGAGTVSLTVDDTGIGIPPDELEAIFEPFVQVGRTLASPKEGAGLGLAISRELARAMGGELSVRSRLGSGSAFTLTLPREPPGAGRA